MLDAMGANLRFMRSVICLSHTVREMVWTFTGALPVVSLRHPTQMGR